MGLAFGGRGVAVSQSRPRPSAAGSEGRSHSRPNKWDFWLFLKAASEVQFTTTLDARGQNSAILDNFAPAAVAMAGAMTERGTLLIDHPADRGCNRVEGASQTRNAGTWLLCATYEDAAPHGFHPIRITGRDLCGRVGAAEDESGGR